MTFSPLHFRIKDLAADIFYGKRRLREKCAARQGSIAVQPECALPGEMVGQG